jgi:hypothetical protein
MILCKHGLFLEIRLQVYVCNGDGLCVFEERTEFLNIVYTSIDFKGLILHQIKCSWHVYN